MNNAVPIQAAENPPSIIMLAGKAYEFREPGKRRATALFGQGIELVKKHKLFTMDRDGKFEIKLAAGGDMLDALGTIIDFIPDVLDFLYEALALPEAERKHIDDNFDGTPELMAAFQAVLERLQSPFVGGVRGSAPATAP